MSTGVSKVIRCQRSRDSGSAVGTHFAECKEITNVYVVEDVE